MYAAQLALRVRVLFAPFGLTLADVEFNEDSCSIITVWDGDSVCVGTMLLLFQEPDTARMRFVAVAPERQSQGIGKMMTLEFEAET